MREEVCVRHMETDSIRTQDHGGRALLTLLSFCQPAFSMGIKLSLEIHLLPWQALKHRDDRGACGLALFGPKNPRSHILNHVEQQH